MPEFWPVFWTTAYVFASVAIIAGGAALLLFAIYAAYFNR